MLKDRLFSFNDNFLRAVEASNRSPDDVKVLLASKTVSPDLLKQCHKLGYSYFGENKVQELKAKQEEFEDLDVVWDFIGHLQSNKVKDVVGRCELIHSVDRLSLAREINKRVQPLNKKQKILIEINTSNEATKSGISSNEWQKLLEDMQALENLKFRGFMTIATNTNDENEIRRCFQNLFKIRKEAALILNLKEEDLELSMGMSNDYVIAIEEGATIVRIGSLIFGPRPTN